MKGVEYKLKLRGLSTPEGTIALATLVNVSETLLDGELKTLRLLVEGISVKRGKISNALRKPLDLTITGISKGSTVLEIQAPTLKESAPELVQQLSSWNGPGRIFYLITIFAVYINLVVPVGAEQSSIF